MSLVLQTLKEQSVRGSSFFFPAAIFYRFEGHELFVCKRVNKTLHTVLHKVLCCACSYPNLDRQLPHLGSFHIYHFLALYHFSQKGLPSLWMGYQNICTSDLCLPPTAQPDLLLKQLKDKELLFSKEGWGVLPRRSSIFSQKAVMPIMARCSAPLGNLCTELVGETDPQIFVFCMFSVPPCLQGGSLSFLITAVQ